MSRDKTSLDKFTKRGLVSEAELLDPEAKKAIISPEVLDAAIPPKISVTEKELDKNHKQGFEVTLPMRMFRGHENVSITDTIGKDGRRYFAISSNGKELCAFSVRPNADIKLNIEKDPLRPNHGTLAVSKSHGPHGANDIGTLLIDEPKGAVKIDRFIGNDAKHIALGEKATGLGNSERRNTLEKRTNTRESHEERMAKAHEQLEDKKTHYAAKRDMRKIRYEEQAMDFADLREDMEFRRRAIRAAHRCALSEAREARAMAKEYCKACHIHPAQASHYCNMQAMAAYQQNFQMALGRAQESMMNLQGDFAGMQQGGYPQQLLPQQGVYGVAANSNMRTEQPQYNGGYGMGPNVQSYAAPGMGITGYQTAGVGFPPMAPFNLGGFGPAPAGNRRF